MSRRQAGDANETLVELVSRAWDARGATGPSRLGPVIDLGPCTIRLSKGSSRLVDLPARALNPIFAIVEACWVLTGRNDLAPLTRHVANMRLFSDDGIVLSGAYGHRLRHAFGSDQLSRAIDALRRDPDTRRVVLSLYHPDDLGSPSKDVPCNTSVMVRIIEGELNVTIINRSNDMLFGLPYNIFCFALIQQYLADALDVVAGEQIHFSNSMHLYAKNLDLAERILHNSGTATLQPAPDSTRFLRRLLRDADAIGSGEFERVADVALRAFLRRSNDSPAEPMGEGQDRADIWLNELYDTWSRRMRGSTVAAFDG